MKKFIYVFTALLCAHQITKAQTQQGNQNLSLGLQYYHSSISTNSVQLNPGLAQTDGNKSSTFMIAPSYGFFVANGSEFGGSLSYSNTTQQQITNTYTTNYVTNNNGYSYGLNLFFKKYVMFENKIGFRAGPYIGYSYGKSTTAYSSTISSYGSGVNNTNTFGGGASCELVYYPAKKLGLATTLLGINYTHAKTTGVTPSTADIFNANFVNSGVSLSVFWVLGK